ncbi:DNA-directed DNA polymerase [Tanacetum coccineum]
MASSHNQSIVDAGSENRPPMPEKGSYIPWSSIFLRCIYGKKDYGKKYYGKMLKELILHGPYQMKEITYQGNPAGNPRVPPFQRYHKEANLTSDVLDQIQYPDYTSLIHIESRKSPTAVLFDVDTGRISIRHYETKEYHFVCSGKITRIMRRYGVSVPALTKDHEGNKIQNAVSRKGNTSYSSYMEIKYSGRYQTWSLLQETLDTLSIQYPRGIVENVLIKVDKFILPIDFVILDMPKDSRVPIILERSFLATARALIDVFNKKITLRVGDDEVIFDMDQSIKRSPAEDDECYGVDDLDDVIKAEAQELLANDTTDSFLLEGLEKSIEQSDLESCE